MSSKCFSNCDDIDGIATTSASCPINISTFSSTDRKNRAESKSSSCSVVVVVVVVVVVMSGGEVAVDDDVILFVF
jgi:hypothetical protein